MSTLLIFIGDWSLYMKALTNLAYIKMYTGLWDREWTIVGWFSILPGQVSISSGRASSLSRLGELVSCPGELVSRPCELVAYLARAS